MDEKSREKILRDAGVLWIIDEPTRVEDMDSLIASYDDQPKRSRFKCSYHNCNRILMVYGTAPFKCTACGHGMMRIQEPIQCSECGESIYANVSQDLDVECENCTENKIIDIEQLEKEVGGELRRLRKKSKKNKESLGIIRNKKDYELALFLLEKKKEKGASEQLLEARKKMGFSQKTLANYLGCSPNYLCEMEKGRKPLNIKAMEFIKEGIKAMKS